MFRPRGRTARSIDVHAGETAAICFVEQLANVDNLEVVAIWQHSCGMHTCLQRHILLLGSLDPRRSADDDGECEPLESVLFRLGPPISSPIVYLYRLYCGQATFIQYSLN